MSNNIIKINDCDELQFEIQNENMPELVAWLSEHGTRVEVISCNEADCCCDWEEKHNMNPCHCNDCLIDMNII